MALPHFSVLSDTAVMLTGKEIHCMKVTGILTAIALLAGVGIAAEKKLKLADLPAPVQKTVHEQTRNAELKGLSKEVENGKTFYEIETIANGKSRDLLVDSTGQIVELEEATTLESVPTAVKAALAPKGKIMKIETVTKGSTVSYEAVVSKNGKKSEVAVEADGTIKE
jgi:uncharacterized membrane protein YkoI